MANSIDPDIRKQIEEGVSDYMSDHLSNPPITDLVSTLWKIVEQQSKDSAALIKGKIRDMYGELVILGQPTSVDPAM